MTGSASELSIGQVAERTGLSTAIDACVLKQACAQAAAWRRSPALAHLVLKVNRSVHDITRPGFYQRITNALDDSGLEPAALTLEITETVLLDGTSATERRCTRCAGSD